NVAHIPSVSLWAAVPHYVSLAPSPRAALALCQRLGDILGAPVETGELDEASERYSEQVSEAVASDDETAAYVAELEERAEILDDEQEIPSGESLAAELTRFLRDRERGNGGPEACGPAGRAQAAASSPRAGGSSARSGHRRPRRSARHGYGRFGRSGSPRASTGSGTRSTSRSRCRARPGSGCRAASPPDARCRGCARRRTPASARRG